MAKTLIIGGGGFIGAHVARALAMEGESVDILDNFSRAVRDPFLEEIEAERGVDLIDADILDETALSLLDDDYTIIYQFAAIIGVRHVMERPYEVLHKNVLIQAKALNRLLAEVESEKSQRKVIRSVRRVARKTDGLPVRAMSPDFLEMLGSSSHKRGY